MDNLPLRFATYFHGSPIALALANPDADHELVLVNDVFGALTGYRTPEVIGRNCRFLQGKRRDQEAVGKLHAFLADPAQPSVRTPIINFKKDGTPFVNLLFMSRLWALGGTTRFIFASQFDVSRSRPELLSEYDKTLAATVGSLSAVAMENGLIIEGSLLTIANTAATVAQAQMTLADLDGQML